MDGHKALQHLCAFKDQSARDSSFKLGFKVWLTDKGTTLSTLSYQACKPRCFKGLLPSLRYSLYAKRDFRFITLLFPSLPLEFAVRIGMGTSFVSCQCTQTLCSCCSPLSHSHHALRANTDNSKAAPFRVRFRAGV